MRRALILLGAFVALAVLLAAVGSLLPVDHTARVRLELGAPAETVYATIAEVAAYPSWRSGLDSLTVVRSSPRLRWRESSRMGTIEFEQVAARPPRVLQAEIQGAREQGFGGSWTWELAPRGGGGTVVTITERGQVYNPLFRLLSRTVFSPYASLERYARDLAAHFGEHSAPERLP